LAAAVFYWYYECTCTNRSPFCGAQFIERQKKRPNIAFFATHSGYGFSIRGRITRKGINLFWDQNRTGFGDMAEDKQAPRDRILWAADAGASRKIVLSYCYG
jgi:hypothetical protein